jgi:hypothetical protein
VRAAEQLVADADARTDLYALAAVLYYLVVGRRVLPEGANNLRLATHGTFRSPELGDAPKELRPVLARALAMRPDDRFPSASDFAAALIDAGLAQ